MAFIFREQDLLKRQAFLLTQPVENGKSLKKAALMSVADSNEHTLEVNTVSLMKQTNKLHATRPWKSRTYLGFDR